MIVHDVKQGDDEWFSLRAGMPTASEFSKIITSKGEPSKSMKNYAALLAAELYAGKPLSSFDGNPWTERGKELEDHAAMSYQLIHDIDLDEVGFVTDDLNRYGCSPDRLVGDNGMVEIKCLKTERHIEAILYYQRNNNAPSGYLQQTQGQLFICEREWCDLVFYHPDLPMLTIRQFPDENIIRGLKMQLAAVLAERKKVLSKLQQFQEAI